MRLNKLLNSIPWKIPLYTFWLSVISKLLYSGEYTLFLRPEFSFILIAGGIALLVFLLAALLAPAPDAAHNSSGTILRVAILLLPLFYFLNTQGQYLGGDSYAKRRIGPPTINRSQNTTAASGATASVPTDYSEATDNPDLEGELLAQYPQTFDRNSEAITILDLYDFPDKYSGQQISLIGMLHTDDPEIAAEYGDGVDILYRFVITCCVADALPAAVLVSGKTPPDCSATPGLRSAVPTPLSPRVINSSRSSKIRLSKRPRNQHSPTSTDNPASSYQASLYA